MRLLTYNLMYHNCMYYHYNVNRACLYCAEQFYAGEW